MHGIKLMNTNGNGVNGGRPLLINDVAKAIEQVRAEINEQAKYYDKKWKIDQLKELKKQGVALYRDAIAEVNAYNAEHQSKVSQIKNTTFEGHSATQEYLDNVKFTKSRLLAEINVNPMRKDEIINKALTSRMGAQAVLELIQNKEIDKGFWTDEVYKKAFINSKTQKELDWEIKKEQQLDVLSKERNEAYDYGSYMGLVKIFTGDVAKKEPSFERRIDIEIEQLGKGVTEV
jgi:hypothetical protein